MNNRWMERMNKHTVNDINEQWIINEQIKWMYNQCWM